jgi:hypothetical protein
MLLPAELTLAEETLKDEVEEYLLTMYGGAYVPATPMRETKRKH